MSLFTADLVMNTAKAAFRVARPFTVYKEIECLKESTATGYSFPSGHATHAGILFTSVAKYKKNRIVTVCCMIAVLLVGISRLYLACHWPLDILVGWALGICFALFVSDIFLKLFDRKEKTLRFFLPAGIVCISAYLIFAVAVDFFGANRKIFSDLSKNLAVLGSFLISVYFEEKYFNFEIPEHWTKRLINFSGALLGAVFFLVVLKRILPKNTIFTAVQYALLIAWGFGLWPAIICKTAKNKKTAT